MIAAKRDSYFFALKPDGGATGDLGRVRDDAGGGGAPVHDALLHVTLCWFGYLERGGRWPVERACRAAASLAIAPFRILLDELVGAERSLLVRSTERAVAPAAFQRRLLTALAREGLRPEPGWRFDPHVTLRRGASRQGHGRTIPISWTVDRFLLIRSEIGYARHMVEGEWRLAG